MGTNLVSAVDAKKIPGMLLLLTYFRGEISLW